MIRMLAVRLPSASFCLTLLAAVFMALEPAMWLAGTWLAEESSGSGLWAFIWVVALVLLSLRSGLPEQGRPPEKLLLALLCTTAVIRLAGQWLDINLLSALLLAVDVYVVARLLRIDTRPFKVSPFWLAILFCFCLPVEVVLQRVAGYPLQVAAAHVAYTVLLPFVTDLSMSGVRLLINDTDVLVDLPCSGSTLLSVLGLICISLHAVTRPSRFRACGNLLGFLVLAICANGLRVAVLALCIGYRDIVGFDVMQPLPHSLIGLLVIVLAGVGLMLMTGLRTVTRAPAAGSTISSRTDDRRARTGLPWPGAALFLVFALTVGALQQQPVDASPSLNLPQVPALASGFSANTQMLTPAEESYFATYGGAAQRASYGPFGLLVVSTQSPLRHLHDPAVCFRGMGYEVSLVGSDFSKQRTVYAVREKTTGAAYDLYVSYLGPSGTVLSIAEVVWRWLTQLGGLETGRWTMVQRVIPRQLAGSAHAERFDAAMQRAFDL